MDPERYREWRMMMRTTRLSALGILFGELVCHRLTASLQDSYSHADLGRLLRALGTVTGGSERSWHRLGWQAAPPNVSSPEREEEGTTLSRCASGSQPLADGTDG
jgi:hypothetical protein